MARPRGHVGPLSEAQHTELMFGPDSVWKYVHARLGEVGFCEDVERRAAWQHWRKELMAEARREARRSPISSHRPWAWRVYDRGYDDGEPLDKLEFVREPIAAGELLPEERVALAERAREGKLRVGTEAERITPQYSEDLERFVGNRSLDREGAQLLELLEAHL